MSDLTRLIDAAAGGDPDAAGRLWPLVYDELRRLAGAQLARENAGHSLDATALVHEAWVRLAGNADQTVSDRRHFYAAAAQAMRRILVEHARAKKRLKRGGGRQREQPDLEAVAARVPDGELLDLHEALDRFADREPVKARLVELRYFAGLTLEQAAECLGLSRSSAARAWRYARAWLHAALADDNSERKRVPPDTLRPPPSLGG
jgi:RNA polymerase sigma factor (TIGR02999 family)